MANTPHLQIILGTTREGRRGDKAARWFHQVAQARADCTAELIDLRDWPMPLFDQAKSPAQGEYTADYQRRWAAKVVQGDGYVLVTPEYNHGTSAVLKNALDAIWAEWNNKPVGFVSYGGPAGGARAVEQLRQVAVELEMAPVRVQVLIPAIHQAFDAQGRPENAATLEKSANRMLDQLVWWARALAQARETLPLPDWAAPYAPKR
jgi:NAD(P)H-dependent FMN reductase